MATKTETVEKVTAAETSANSSTVTGTDTSNATAATKKSTSTKKTSTTADEKATKTKENDAAKPASKTKTTSKSASSQPPIGEIKPTKRPAAEKAGKRSSKKAETKTDSKTDSKTSKADTKADSNAQNASDDKPAKKTAKNVYKKAVENKEVSKVVTTPIAPSTQKETTKKETTKKDTSKKDANNTDTAKTEEPKKDIIPEIKVSEVELMDAPKKARNKYAVMLVKEHEDGSISTHHIGTALCEFLLVALFVLILVCACVIVYDSISLKKLRTEVVQQIAMNTELTEQNEILSVENDSLSSKVAVLSETVSKKAATEEAMTQEESENAMPKGFPLSGGTSTMTSGTDDNVPILKFDASAGINIVSSGTGTVLAIEEDADYGHRIIIDHGNGYRSIYRNSGEPLVKEGDSLGKGYILFSIGNGNEQVGYQIMVDNQYIDPMDVIEING